MKIIAGTGLIAPARGYHYMAMGELGDAVSAEAAPNSRAPSRRLSAQHTELCGSIVEPWFSHRRKKGLSEA